MRKEKLTGVHEEGEGGTVNIDMYIATQQYSDVSKCSLYTFIQ